MLSGQHNILEKPQQARHWHRRQRPQCVAKVSIQRICTRTRHLQDMKKRIRHTKARSQPKKRAQTRVTHRPPSRGRQEAPHVKLSVDFRELMLHQVVSFSTRFVQTVTGLYQPRHRITLPELRTLFLLGRYGNLAPIRVAELATTDRATVTRAISALRRRKLIRVRADPSHHKRTLATLTPAGARLHDELAALVNYRNDWLRSEFTNDELKTLFALLRRLERAARSLPTQLPADQSSAQSFDRGANV
jgi:DNA-binding MarR family transcriptional regulator